VDRWHRWVIIGFIVFSTVVFVAVGRPVRMLILAGALNGLILPIALAIMLWAACRRRVVGDYRHPLWMTCAGLVVVATMSYLGAVTLWTEFPRLLQ
jgi:Mn2+/Fe2+ NRAMP family transporter